MLFSFPRWGPNSAERVTTMTGQRRRLDEEELSYFGGEDDNASDTVQLDYSSMYYKWKGDTFTNDIHQVYRSVFLTYCWTISHVSFYFKEYVMVKFMLKTENRTKEIRPSTAKENMLCLLTNTALHVQLSGLWTEERS